MRENKSQQKAQRVSLIEETESIFGNWLELVTKYQIKKADLNARNLLLGNLSDFELLTKWVSDNLKAGIEYKTAGIISFKTELEAEYFTQETVGKNTANCQKITEPQ